ncbi:MAG: potassium channel family protein [Acidobacteria bacterium]|nr:potassium channel family protein [Acidobacteriota bacterium]
MRPARRAPAGEAATADAHDWADVFIDFFERRTTGQLLQLWFGIIVICGAVYWLSGASPRRSMLMEFGQPVTFNAGGLLKAMYFSFVTATSVGFGDVLPVGPARALAIAEAVAGLLIFGAVIAKFVSRRQERLVEETHRLAFEDRLDRVQTNLHLVLSDLQAIAGLCDESRVPPARIRARLESAVLVFSGELRTIHDLLYRPQQTPEEPVLEGILATLAAALQELGDVLACGAPANRSAMLTSQLQGMTRLADGICGECVPRAYADHLREWMDRVKAQAARLT